MLKGYFLTIIKLIFCFVISGLCLFLIFRKVDISEVIKILSQVNYFWLLLATIIGVLKMWATAFRWGRLGLYCNRLSLTKSFHFYAIGVMTNMTLPFRAGDILRARMIANAAKVSNTTVLGTIASEHILDFIALCFLLLSCLVFYSYSWPIQVIPTVITFFIIILPFFGMVFLLKKNTKYIKQVKDYISQFLPERFLFLPNMLANFYLAFFQLGSFVNILKIFMMTACIWMAQAFWIYTLFCSLGMVGNYSLGFEAVLVLMVMMGITVMIPASPGYIGTFHLMVLLGLTQMGVPNSISLAYAILTHAHAVAVAILIGLYSLWKVSIKLPFNLMHKSATT